MREIITTVYEYDELPTQEAKEKAKAWMRQHIEYDSLGDVVRERIVELLKENGIEGDPQPRYSLGYSQGDGVMFEGHFEFKGHWFKATQMGYYSHEYSRHLDWRDDTTPQEVADEFAKLYTSICIEAKQAGYRYIEAESSDENIEDTLRANEYTFTADGKRFG